MTDTPFHEQLATLTARVISLPARTDRRDEFTAHAQEQGIPFSFVDGVSGRGSPWKNISCAHKNCIRAAMANGEPYALVMEDDCLFPSADGFRWWLRQAPPLPWDIYLAGIYNGEPLRDGLVKAFCALHCYIVAAPFYRTFLTVSEEEHIDHALAGKGTYYVCLPFAAIQRNGFSNNKGKVMNYQDLVPGKYRT